LLNFTHLQEAVTVPPVFGGGISTRTRSKRPLEEPEEPEEAPVIEEEDPEDMARRLRPVIADWQRLYNECPAAGDM